MQSAEPNENSQDGVRPEHDELPVRHAARVLLVDPDDRLLLFRTHTREDGRGFWYPVGGEVEPGETHEQAVIREAFEETGLSGLQLGPEIIRRHFVFRWREFTWDAHERWWLARVAHFEPDFSGMEDIEIGDFAACRWLSMAELSALQESGDVLTPANLLELLGDLLAGQIPAVPIAVGE